MSNRQLEKLAGEDPQRLAVLAGRTERSRSRTRFLLCRACGNDRDLSDRDPGDICDDCLVDLWNARSVMAGAFKAGRRSGLVPLRIAERCHDLPYPHLAGSLKPDTNAPFARDGGSSFGTESAPRTLQHLYFELLTALASVLPCDPQAKEDAEDAFALAGQHCDGSFYGIGTIALRLPKEAHKALMDLWRFFDWHSHASYFEGFEAGRALISGLATGTHTAESMVDEVAEQTKNLRASMEKAKRKRQRASA